MKSIGITGHQNIPSIAIDAISKSLYKIFNEYGNDFMCISSLAIGADQMAAEKALSMNAKLHVVVPCKNYESTFKSSSDLATYSNLKSKASIVDTLHFDEPSEEAFLEAGRKITSLSDVLIAIWDGKKAKGKGGTADIVEYAYKHKKSVIIVWPEGLVR